LTTEVTVDGVRYVPVREVIVNHDLLMQKLIEVWWGPIRNEEEKATAFAYAGNLRVIVTDTEDRGVSIEDFIESLTTIPASVSI
jgi:hypothetical protein